MKVDKDDLFLGAIGIGIILCSPFILSFYAGKWIYGHTPWELKKKKELDKEIHLLEEKLGLYGRNNKVLHYDPLYFRNNLGDRKDYCKDLKKKLEKGYVSPPIIIAITYAPQYTLLYHQIQSMMLCFWFIKIITTYLKNLNVQILTLGRANRMYIKKVNCLNRNIDISMHRQGLSVVITKIII